MSIEQVPRALLTLRTSVSELAIRQDCGRGRSTQSKDNCGFEVLPVGAPANIRCGGFPHMTISLNLDGQRGAEPLFYYTKPHSDLRFQATTWLRRKKRQRVHPRSRASAPPTWWTKHGCTLKVW